MVLCRSANLQLVEGMLLDLQRDGLKMGVAL